MDNTVRIYGKTVNTWKAWETFIWRGQEKEREVITQYEVEYKEYDKDGNLVAVGTEDFSAERARVLDNKWVWTWDGKTYNKGGHRMFDCQGSIKIDLNHTQEVYKYYLRNKYSDATLIQMRTF